MSRLEETISRIQEPCPIVTVNGKRVKVLSDDDLAVIKRVQEIAIEYRRERPIYTALMWLLNQMQHGKVPVNHK